MDTRVFAVWFMQFTHNNLTAFNTSPQVYGMTLPQYLKSMVHYKLLTTIAYTYMWIYYGIAIVKHSIL